MTGRIIRQWSTWAQSHRRRYHATRRRPGMLTLTLRRSMAGAVRNDHRHRVNLTWAPRIRLHVGFTEIRRIHRLRGWRRQSPEAARSAPGAYAVSQVFDAGAVRKSGRGLREDARPHRAGRAAMDLEARRGADLRTPLQRVLARTSSLGMLPGGIVSPRVTRDPARMTVRAGKRVELRRPGVAGVLHSPSHERTAPQAETELSTTLPPQAPAAPGPLKAAVMSESSMNLLTERVIRQIDRRIVAYRERLGRPA